MKFLELHEKLLREGLYTKLGEPSGLCDLWFGGDFLENNAIFYLLKPTLSDAQQLINGEYEHFPWWGSDDQNPREGEYTPLRQNIILLCAALNGEL